VKRSVPQRLRDAASLFEERNATYGGNYRQFGRVMSCLFPDGLGPEPLTEEEWGRLAHITHIMTKLTRYCRNLRRGGHQDSMEDMAVYAQMTAELDEEAAELAKGRVSPVVAPVSLTPEQQFQKNVPSRPASLTTDDWLLDERTQ